VPKTPNPTPMDYKAPASQKVDHVTAKHLIEFFVNSMLNVNLGLICNAHQVWSDKLGPGSKQCLELARLASIGMCVHCSTS